MITLATPDVDIDVDTAHAVDCLHEVRKTIKHLQDEEARLKAQILASNQDVIESAHIKAVISHVAPTTTTDYPALIRFLKVKPAVLEKFQKAKAGYAVINIRPI